MPNITRIVAIDGPAGAGKSTTARRVARALGFAFLDTGAMYRAATWCALHNGADLDAPDALAASTEAMELVMNETNGEQRVAVGGVDVTDAIRTPEITRLIYKLDQNPAVRRRLVALQREIGARGPTVAEGRDIGTVVFPEAACKIFLDASLEERTRRRARELESKGVAVDLEALRAEIHDRDEKNRTRRDSPLKQAEDAVLVDTTDMTPDEVVDAIVRLARERL
ncbi:MAG TPA: (d)CMP kinase [Candidatus Hydrogenedentes bacterium]|nr:(d)CMP kinase [Candidatus Hydrogenedentota bacterium]